MIPINEISNLYANQKSIYEKKNTRKDQNPTKIESELEEIKLNNKTV